MIDERDFFWKNFRLGTELQISGTFIYNGIYSLDNMESFHNVEECFEFLYNISVGIERLQKILVILVEHDEILSQEEFEKSLITHNHLDLLKRIKLKRQINFGKTHTKFLALLDNFYKTVRYERFNISSVYKPSQEKEKLVDFISCELNIELKEELNKFLENSDRVKTFIGKAIKTITISFFDLIRVETSRLGIFTHEIRYSSKAFKIFTEQEFDFINEKLMQREVFLHLLKNFPNDELKKFIDNINPLQLEQYHTNNYIESMMNIHKNSSVKDEILQLYDNIRPINERITEIMAIGSDINFDDLIDEDYDEFE